jgi:hypothetical protein
LPILRGFANRWGVLLSNAQDGLIEKSRLRVMAHDFSRC